MATGESRLEAPCLVLDVEKNLGVNHPSIAVHTGPGLLGVTVFVGP